MTERGERQLIAKTGTWFTYGETRLGQGRENAKSYLEEHPEVAGELEGRIRGTWETASETPVTVGAGVPARNGAEEE